MYVYVQGTSYDSECRLIIQLSDLHISTNLENLPSFRLPLQLTHEGAIVAGNDAADPSSTCEQ